MFCFDLFCMTNVDVCTVMHASNYQTKSENHISPFTLDRISGFEVIHLGTRNLSGDILSLLCLCAPVSRGWLCHDVDNDWGMQWKFGVFKFMASIWISCSLVVRCTFRFMVTFRSEKCVTSKITTKQCNKWKWVIICLLCVV